MRILHVVGDSGFGGGARVILSLATAATAAGHDVEVLTTDSAFAAAAREAGLAVWDIDVIRRPIRPAFDLAGALRLARRLRTRPVDLVHTHTSKAGIVGRWAAHRAGVPIVVHTVHGFSFHEATPAPVVRAVAAVERRAARWCDAVVTVSEFHRDWAVRLGIDRPPHLRAIPNGVVEERARPSGSTVADGLAHDGPLLVSTGRVVAGKGLEELVDAVAALAPRHPDLRLAVVGEGDLEAELRTRAETTGVADRVTFTGFREDVGDVLAAATAVVLPSHREGMSIAVLEAMAAGVPLVASSIASNREVTEDGALAVLVPPGDVTGLVRAIEEVLDHPSAAAERAERARFRFRRLYSAPAMADAYLALYEELAPPGGEPVRLGPRHAPALAALHVAAFPAFFLTALGPRFLAAFYRALLADGGVAVGVLDRGRLVAFAAGAERADGLYRRLARRHGPALALAALPALVRRPGRALRLARSFGLQEPGADAADGPTLLSIAVDPARGGQGLGRAVLDRFEQLMAVARPGEVVRLTTDAHDNDAVLGFYRRRGYRAAGSVSGPGGRLLTRLEKPLAPPPADG